MTAETEMSLAVAEILRVTIGVAIRRRSLKLMQQIPYNTPFQYSLQFQLKLSIKAGKHIFISYQANRLCPNYVTLKYA